MRVKQVKGRKQYRDFQTGEAIKVGELQYVWQPYRCPVRRSKQFPTRSSMTQSETLGRAYDLEGRLGKIEDVSEVEGIVGELEDLAGDCEDQAGNVENYFGESPTVELLRERAYRIEGAVDELQSLLDDPDTELDAFRSVSVS